MTSDEPDDLQSLEAQRVFASVARSLLGETVSLPTIGRFEVRERLGSGGMGEVYGAFDPEHRRDVALKFLRNDLGADSEAVTRLKREARALARLEHPNVVKVYEVGVSEDRVFIAMERLRGQTLSAELERDGALSVTRAWSVLSQLCAAVGRAHAEGIIHRDLKPANIFSHEGPPPRVKVLDFGIAKGVGKGTLEASTASGTVMGTPFYMSPEQARDSTKIDHRCDLWAVAIIAYECVVGRRPFVADNLAKLAVELLTKDLPVPSAQADVPPGFDAWFARAAHRDLEQRYGSAAELVRGLAEVFGQSPPAWAQQDAPRSRVPWIAGVIVVAVGVGAALWLAGGNERQAPRPPKAPSPVVSPPVSASTSGSAAEPASEADTSTPSAASTTAATPADSTGSDAPRPQPRPPRPTKPKPKPDVDDLEF
ncbi:MAG: serine/threonine-protein kinase [Myxococcota bacterium]